MHNFVDFSNLTRIMKGQAVARPNSTNHGSLAGHAAGEPFEKSVYSHLKELYPGNIFKQHEYLNDIYLKNPKKITTEERYALLDSPTVLFLLSRGDKATLQWSPDNIFEEKQNDTADIIFHKDGFYQFIDVKTRNIGKHAQAPNIISAYKLAKTCANMIDNKEYDKFTMHYVEIDWEESGNQLLCQNAHHADLFKSTPNTLYINWAAAMQIQFHVCDLDQSWDGTMEEWARCYIRAFVNSAKERTEKMINNYVTPFLKYIQEN